ncbi:MAG: phenylalanine--tRNA ligase subunit alpha [Candidatus Babeliales bacterium]
MDELKQIINTCRNNMEEAFALASSLQEIEQKRVTFLGRQGHITRLFKQLSSCSLDEKKIIGPLINALKKDAESLYEQKKQHLQKKKAEDLSSASKYFDVTSYLVQKNRGSLHLYTQTVQQLSTLFTSMGYTVVEGPELETNYYNFEALNIPNDHPSRDLMDTFWIHYPHTLLRTHTSSVQIHAMETRKPPIAVFAPGRVFRKEATDASHECVFMQGECLLVDKNISLAHLIGTAQMFLRTFFDNESLSLRLRPGYFPFVEPGFEIDCSCPFCQQGCSFCKHTTWIELLGAGLVHPHVLQGCSIDPDVYSGFALGFGIDRLIMIKHGIQDIRLLRSNTLHFLNQF